MQIFSTLQITKCPVHRAFFIDLANRQSMPKRRINDGYWNAGLATLAAQDRPIVNRVSKCGRCQLCLTTTIPMTNNPTQESAIFSTRRQE